MATRSKKKSGGLKILTGMKPFLHIAIWKLMYDTFKVSYDSFCEKEGTREDLRLKRTEAVKNLEKTDENTLSLISTVSKAIQIEVDKKETKYKEFFPEGTLKNATEGNKIDRILSLEQLLKGFENNKNYEFYAKYNQQLITAKAKLEEEYDIVNKVTQKEKEAINILKDEENKYDFAYRKVKHFVKDEVNPNEYPNFFDEW